MNEDSHCIRWCAGLLASVILLRLFGAGISSALCRPSALSAIMYLETGRIVHPWQYRAPSPEIPSDTLAEDEPTAPAPPLPAIVSAQAAQAVEVTYFCDLRPDISALAAQPLTWDLTEDQPSVLIFHTHATESYEKNGEDYSESSPYHTSDTRYNMVAVGDLVAAILEQNGIRVIHDRTLHDEPSYEEAYDRARTSVEDYLSRYPSIRLVLDLHRDAADRDGVQISTTCLAGGRESAKLMLILGSNAGDYDHPYWLENLSLGVKLQALLGENYPELFRPLQLSAGRYNQDLCPGCLLVEVGTAGNTREQAFQAATLLAQGIVALAHGTQADSPVTESGRS